MRKEIVFKIAPTAKVEIKVLNGTDASCGSDIKPYEDALKGESKRKPEPAFYKPVAKKTANKKQ